MTDDGINRKGRRPELGFMSARGLDDISSSANLTVSHLLLIDHSLRKMIKGSCKIDKTPFSIASDRQTFCSGVLGRDFGPSKTRSWGP